MRTRRGSTRRWMVVAAVAAAVLPALTLAPPASAAPGQLDPTFDGDGMLALNQGFSNDVATGVVLQPDGKIIVAGYDDGGSPDFSSGSPQPRRLARHVVQRHHVAADL